MQIDHAKSASTSVMSGNAVAGDGDVTYPVDGADETWSTLRVRCGRSPARFVLVGAT